MTRELIALDTSVAVAYLVRSHSHHALVKHRLAGRSLALTSHSLAETYSVLTRLPGDARLTSSDAVTLLEDALPQVLVPDVVESSRVHVILAECGVMGGAVYDGLVALAARGAGAALATRDARAVGTYEAIGVVIDLIVD